LFCEEMNYKTTAENRYEKYCNVNSEKIESENPRICIERNNGEGNTAKNPGHSYCKKIVFTFAICKVFGNHKEKCRPENKLQMFPYTFVNRCNKRDNQIFT